MSSTCVDVEEVGKKTPRDRLMTDHNHVLLTLKFHDNWLQSTHDIHVRLHTTPAHLVTISSPVSSSHVSQSHMSHHNTRLIVLSHRHTCLIVTPVSLTPVSVTPVSLTRRCHRHLSHRHTCLIVTRVSPSRLSHRHLSHRHTCLNTSVSSARVSHRHACLSITPVSLTHQSHRRTCLNTPISSSQVPRRHTCLIVRVSTFVYHHDCLNLPRQILPQSQTIQSFVAATTAVRSTHMRKQHLLSSCFKTYHSLPRHLTMSSCRDASPWYCP